MRHGDGSQAMTTARSDELRALAQRVADALPAEIAEEIVLTGSVSRGVADDISDIEMLVVTREPLELDECFRLAPTGPHRRTASPPPARAISSGSWRP